jgi:hypothetical protein
MNIFVSKSKLTTSSLQKSTIREKQTFSLEINHFEQKISILFFYLSSFEITTD